MLRFNPEQRARIAEVDGFKREARKATTDRASLMREAAALIERLSAEREGAPAAHGELERAIERADTARRLMNDGRTELGAISDVWGAYMDRRDKFTADLRLILNAARAALSTQGESRQTGAVPLASGTETT